MRNASVAQLVEQRFRKPQVTRSNRVAGCRSRENHAFSRGFLYSEKAFSRIGMRYVVRLLNYELLLSADNDDFFEFGSFAVAVSQEIGTSGQFCSYLFASFNSATKQLLY